MKDKFLLRSLIFVVLAMVTVCAVVCIAKVGVHLEQYIGVFGSDVAVFLISFALTYGVFYISMKDELK